MAARRLVRVSTAAREVHPPPRAPSVGGERRERGTSEGRGGHSFYKSECCPAQTYHLQSIHTAHQRPCPTLYTPTVPPSSRRPRYPRRALRHVESTPAHQQAQAQAYARGRGRGRALRAEAHPAGPGRRTTRVSSGRSQIATNMAGIWLATGTIAAEDTTETVATTGVIIEATGQEMSEAMATIDGTTTDHATGTGTATGTAVTAARDAIRTAKQAVRTLQLHLLPPQPLLASQ